MARPVGWGSVSTLEIRPLGPGDDIDVQSDLAERAFGLMSQDDRDFWRRRSEGMIAAGRFTPADE